MDISIINLDIWRNAGKDFNFQKVGMHQSSRAPILSGGVKFAGLAAGIRFAACVAMFGRSPCCLLEHFGRHGGQNVLERLNSRLIWSTGLRYS